MGRLCLVFQLATSPPKIYTLLRELELQVRTSSRLSTHLELPYRADNIAIAAEARTRLPRIPPGKQ